MLVGRMLQSGLVFAFFALTGCSVAPAREQRSVFSAQNASRAVFVESSPAIVLPPQNQSSAERLLIIVPGMNKSASEYENLAREIQQTAPQRLWVGIVQFSADLVNPPQLNAAVEYIFNRVRAQGFADARPELTTIAGHSVGGILAQYFVNQKSYSSLILMASYLVRAEGSSSLPQADLPVLTLGGELDGQTRMTRISLDALSSMTQGLDILKKPVIILPKINHSQFSGPERMPSDLPAEIEYAEAQQRIARSITDFLIVNEQASAIADLKADATQRLSNAVQGTRELFSPYWRAQEQDQHWCAEVQREIYVPYAGILESEIAHTVHKNLGSFAASKPKIEKTADEKLHFKVDSFLIYHPNVMDRSTLPEAAQTLACKTKSGAAVAALTQRPEVSSLSCRDYNMKAYEWALSALNPSARERFLRHGRSLRFAPDRQVGAGVLWLPAGLSFKNDETDRSAVVTSTALNTDLRAPAALAGMQYCKLLSPTRAMEWMLVDGLRDNF